MVKKLEYSIKGIELSGDNLYDIVKQITVLNLGDATTTVDGKKKLETEKLVRSVAVAIFGLKSDPSDNDKKDQSETPEWKDAIDSLTNSIDNFLDFLDYNNDKKIDLVKNENGKIEMGDDVAMIVDEAMKVKSFYKDAKDFASILIAVINTLTYTLEYYNSERFNETKQDALNFKTSIEDTYRKFVTVYKNVDGGQIIAEKLDDVISFVLLLCVIICPIIKMCNEKIDKINNGETIDENITSEEITNVVKSTYGFSLEVIIITVNNLVKSMLKEKDIKSGWEKFKGFFKCSCTKGN